VLSHVVKSKQFQTKWSETKKSNDGDFLDIEAELKYAQFKFVTHKDVHASKESDCCRWIKYLIEQ
jgi:hypothetical protein